MTLLTVQLHNSEGATQILWAHTGFSGLRLLAAVLPRCPGGVRFMGNAKHSPEGSASVHRGPPPSPTPDPQEGAGERESHFPGPHVGREKFPHAHVCHFILSSDCSGLGLSARADLNPYGSLLLLSCLWGLCSRRSLFLANQQARCMLTVSPGILVF